MHPHLDEPKAGLRKARSDLLSARILVEHSPLVLGPAAFHCQQATEKSLKAFLVCGPYRLNECTAWSP